LILGILLAAVGPYGTFAQASVTERIVYWVGVVLIAFAVYRPSCAVAARAALRVGFSAKVAWTAAVFAMSFPLTLLVWLASYRHTPSLWPSVTEYVGFYGSVVLIGGGLMLVVWLVRRASQPLQPVGATAAADDVTGTAAKPDDELAVAPSISSRLVSRLPLELQSEVLALQMEDHYVRVHTELGNTLLLMRMRDAVSEMEGIEGAQVHRTWWIARTAAQSLTRAGRRASVELRNGLRVPISRERMQSLPKWIFETSRR
jgi:hypothetical protein